jgi:hypothetical protein
LSFRPLPVRGEVVENPLHVLARGLTSFVDPAQAFEILRRQLLHRPPEEG